jgi:phospholipid/cholesterol/gamma-HCH transport system ATP-binding protein
MNQDQQKRTVIEVEDLVTHYGERMILKGVSLNVHKGEILVIMGGSGSGKSTLLRHLLCLNRATSGQIRILGQDVEQLGATGMHELRKEMGVAFQGGALFGSMTVGENVMLPLREHTKLDENTMRIMMRMKLEVVNLTEAEELMPAELSGGMIKRAALARAVVMDPKLLFFDEPSAGLDPVAAVELDELILKLRDALNMTIVVVTHELDSAFKIADRITILDKGEIIMTDTVDNVRHSDNRRVQALLNRIPRDDAIDADEYMRRLTGYH